MEMKVGFKTICTPCTLYFKLPLSPFLSIISNQVRVKAGNLFIFCISLAVDE